MTWWTRRDESGRAANRCELCGRDTSVDSGRCTNNRCSECHRRYCTPGGNTSPGHGRGTASAYTDDDGRPIRLSPEELAEQVSERLYGELYELRELDDDVVNHITERAKWAIRDGIRDARKRDR